MKSRIKKMRESISQLRHLSERFPKKERDSAKMAIKKIRKELSFIVKEEILEV